MLIMVEGFTRSEGGVGAMLLDQNRHLHLAHVEALQATILLVGLVQDAALAAVRRAVEYRDVLLNVKNVCVTLGENLVLRDVNLQVCNVVQPGRVTGQVVALPMPVGHRQDAALSRSRWSERLHIGRSACDGCSNSGDRRQRRSRRTRLPALPPPHGLGQLARRRRASGPLVTTGTQESDGLARALRARGDST